jgi:hypothetical protein
MRRTSAVGHAVASGRPDWQAVGAAVLTRMISQFDIPPDADEEAAERIGVINDALTRLAARRMERIAVEGRFLQSKIAWKVAAYNQAILYRVVALAHGEAPTFC